MMLRPTRIFGIVLATGLLCLAPVSAFSQGEDVLTRLRPDYDAMGIPLGAFRLFPSVDVQLAYDDNIFRAPSDTRHDYVFEVAPRAALRSQWSRHSLVVSGGANFINYARFSSEDQTNWDIGADGRLDILQGSFIGANTSYTSTHEPRFAPDSPGYIAEPIPFSTFHAAASLTFKPNRFGIGFGAILDEFNFGSAPIVGGGTLDNNDRDRTQYQLSTRASYDFSPGYSAFVEATYDSRDFDLEFDRSGVDRDSDGYRIDGGVALMLGRLVEGELFAGYLSQDYKAPLTDVSGFDYGVDLSWYATELMTVRLSASNLIHDTTLGSASSARDQTISAGLDYEVLRNVIAQGGVSYTNTEFEGAARNDDTVAVNVGARYLINRFLSAQLRYRYSERTSSVVSPTFGQEFADNTVVLGLRWQD